MLVGWARARGLLGANGWDNTCYDNTRSACSGCSNADIAVGASCGFSRNDWTESRSRNASSSCQSG